MTPSPSKDCRSVIDDPPALDAAVPRLLALTDEAARRRFVARCLAHFAPDSLFAHLKDESERYQHIEAHASLRLAEALILAGELAERPDGVALGLLARGDALRCLGRYQESVTVLDQAGAAFLAHGDEVGWARTRLGWLFSSHCLGRGEEAVTAVARAREVLIEHRQWLRAAGLDLNAARVYQELGHYEQALALTDRAQEMYERLGASAAAQVAWAKTNKGILLTLLGDFAPALRLHDEARRIFIQRGDTINVRKQDHNIAYVYASQGHFTRALRRYADVLAESERAGMEAEAAWVALDMVECYLSLNRDAEALALAEETIARFERCGTPTETAKARFYCALARARLGDRERALALLEEAAEASAAAGLDVQCALVTLQRAMLHLDERDWPAVLAEAATAGALFADRGLIPRRAQADLVMARAALALGDTERAADLARGVLEAARAHDVRWLMHEGHHVLGGVARARGDLRGALRDYGRAVESIEQLQSSLAVELRSHFLQDKVQVYEDAVRTSLRLAQPELAFAYLERAKSRALVDYLAGNLEVQIRARPGADPALLAELARLREEHAWFYNRLSSYGLAERSETGSGPAPEASLQAAIREREGQIARLVERLALERTEGLEVAGAPADAAAYLPALAPGTVLLEYYFDRDGGAVFVASTAGIGVVPLTVHPGDLQRLLRQWQLNLGATAGTLARGGTLTGLGRSARGMLANLYHALLAPVAGHLAGCERLIIVPYGPTHAVPFHALHDGERYLLERLEVATCPSSRLLRLCAERPRRAMLTGGRPSALVVAHSDGGRLPLVLEEARDVAALLPGESYVEAGATRGALIEAAPHHDIVHLAAHGEARLDNPTFAHLKLADGHLTTADVFNLDLRGALVTLSACETGRTVVAGGDELVGLSRGFLYAGASTLVQSLWRVEDGSTARLMAAFYRALGAGRPTGAALRQAQLAVLGEGGHPYFWAPFQLIGDAGSS